jgi:hypothetical protein
MERDNTFDIFDCLALMEEEQLSNEFTVDVLLSFAEGLSAMADAAQRCAEGLADLALALSQCASNSLH